MSFLLKFFGGGLAMPATLLRLKALLIITALMLLACLALTTWALWERSGKFACAVDRVTLADQVRVLSAGLDRQNASIDATAQAGREAVAATRELIAAAKKHSAANASLLIDMREVLNRPTPARADGTAAGCEDAWAEIRARGVAK